MDFEIKTYIGVGPLTFGMSSEEARKVLQVPFKTIDNTSIGIPTDFFKEIGIFISYKSPGVCEAFEFAGPASPTFKGEHLLARSYREVELWLKKLDPEVVLKDTGLTSYNFGFGLFTPSARGSLDLPVEGVIVFEEGYYG